MVGDAVLVNCDSLTNVARMRLTAIQNEKKNPHVQKMKARKTTVIRTAVLLGL